MIRTDARFPRHARLAALVAAETAPLQLAHDQLHVERVYNWCLHLALNYCRDNILEVDLAGACGLVHDLVHIPKSHRDRPLGSEQSAAAAGSFLTDVGYTAADVMAVVEAVRTCSWSRGLQAASDLGRILQDADRLDAIGAIGISRCFSCAQEIGDADSSFYHAADPLYHSERDLDDRHHALDHFFAKLTKLAGSMHFPLAQAEAQRRHAMLEHFVSEFGLDVANPVQAESCQPEH